MQAVFLGVCINIKKIPVRGWRYISIVSGIYHHYYTILSLQ